MSNPLGPTNFLVRYRQIAIICTKSAYRRKNGSVYVVVEGKRLNLTPCSKPVTTGPWPYSYEVDLP